MWPIEHRCRLSFPGLLPEGSLLRALPRILSPPLLHWVPFQPSSAGHVGLSSPWARSAVSHLGSCVPGSLLGKHPPSLSAWQTSVALQCSKGAPSLGGLPGVCRAPPALSTAGCPPRQGLHHWPQCSVFVYVSDLKGTWESCHLCNPSA